MDILRVSSKWSCIPPAGSKDVCPARSILDRYSGWLCQSQSWGYNQVCWQVISYQHLLLQNLKLIVYCRSAISRSHQSDESNSTLLCSKSCPFCMCVITSHRHFKKGGASGITTWCCLCHLSEVARAAKISSDIVTESSSWMLNSDHWKFLRKEKSWDCPYNWGRNWKSKNASLFWPGSQKQQALCI